MSKKTLCLGAVVLCATCALFLAVDARHIFAGDAREPERGAISERYSTTARHQASTSPGDWEHTLALTFTPAFTVYIPLASSNYWPGAIGFDYGVQANPVGDTYANIGHIQTMGLGWVKLSMHWDLVEPVQGSYEWGPWDELVNAYEHTSIKVLLSVSDAPSWARGGQDLSVEGPPNNPQDLADFLGAVVHRYCNHNVEAIEIWDEQNLHYKWGNLVIDPAAYMALLKPTYNTIKAICPRMTVVSGALTPTGAPLPLGMDDFVYLEGMYEAGLKNYSDAIGAHPAGYNVAPWVASAQEACDFITQQQSTFRGPCNTLHHSWYFLGTMEGYHNIMAAYADDNKRIVVTEFGWAVSEDPSPGYQYAYDNTYAEQAEWTVWAFQWGKGIGWAGPMMLFNLDYGLTSPALEISYWSLLTPTGTVPAYSAIAAMPKTK